MKIKKVKLNFSLYFDDDGYPCDSLKEARDSSIYPEDVLIIKPKQLQVKYFDELTEEQKEIIKNNFEDYENTVALINIRTKNIELMMSLESLLEQIKQGLYTCL